MYGHDSRPTEGRFDTGKYAATQNLTKAQALRIQEFERLVA
jgi:hypothetical protein